MSNIREFLEAIFNGQIPVTRRNRQTGAKEVIYFKYDEDRDELIEAEPFFSPQKDTTTKAHRDLSDMNETRAFPVYGEKLTKFMKYLPVKDVGLSALRAYQTLKNNKNEMDRLKLVGGDNYFHRKGMCEVAQNGLGDAVIGFGGGIAKEGVDFYKKAIKGDASAVDTLKDSWKDLSNNWQGMIHGLINPNTDCKIWLKDLDWKSNKFIKQERPD